MRNMAISDKVTDHSEKLQILNSQSYYSTKLLQNDYAIHVKFDK